MNVLTLYTDASWVPKKHWASAGWVLLDEEGNFTSNRAKLPKCNDASRAELSGMSEALKWTLKEIGDSRAAETHLALRNDCIGYIRYLQQETCLSSNRRDYAILREVYKSLGKFKGWDAEWVNKKKTPYMLACHNLAKHAMNGFEAAPSIKTCNITVRYALEARAKEKERAMVCTK